MCGCAASSSSVTSQECPLRLRGKPRVLADQHGAGRNPLSFAPFCRLGKEHTPAVPSARDAQTLVLPQPVQFRRCSRKWVCPTSHVIGTNGRRLRLPKHKPTSPIRPAAATCSATSKAVQVTHPPWLPLPWPSTSARGCARGQPRRDHATGQHLRQLQKRTP